MKLVQATDAALWQCDICKATGEWADSWASYGSYILGAVALLVALITDAERGQS